MYFYDGNLAEDTGGFWLTDRIGEKVKSASPKLRDLSQYPSASGTWRLIIEDTTSEKVLSILTFKI